MWAFLCLLTEMYTCTRAFCNDPVLYVRLNVYICTDVCVKNQLAMGLQDM